MGVRQIAPSLIELGHSLTATTGEMLRHIILPAIVTSILTGIAFSGRVLWIVLVPAEMLGVNEGLVILF